MSETNVRSQRRLSHGRVAKVDEEDVKSQKCFQNQNKVKHGYTQWHTTNAICCISSETLVTRAYLITK
jgi:hypothetical protein